MPGGVMLQIGIHYTDVLTYLMGPVKAVRGQFAQLVLPGDNPDVASLILEHENGALSTLNASYASASEYYLMNIYGKDATAYYDMHGGLRLLKRGEDKPQPVTAPKNDTFVEELEEFAAAVRGGPQARGRRRVCDRVARGGARGDSLGARRAQGRGGGDPEERLISIKGGARPPASAARETTMKSGMGIAAAWTAGILIASALAPATLQAQDYPNRPSTWSCRSRPAGRATWWRASSPSRWARRSARRW